MLTSITVTFEFVTDSQQRTFQRLCEPFVAHGAEITDIDYLEEGIGFILTMDMTDVPFEQLSGLVAQTNVVAQQVEQQQGLHPMYMPTLMSFKNSMN